MSSGDIVRHDDYPQWGRGYVIRANKRASEVFFLWGGKRRIEAGEPLEPTETKGVEAEFFDVCAGLSSRSWARGRHSVYAIELDPAVLKHRAFRARDPGRADGGCLYIGVTGVQLVDADDGDLPLLVGRLVVTSDRRPEVHANATRVVALAARAVAASGEVGDTVTLAAPRGPERLEIIAVRYDDLR